jgi:hypothetical protein
MHGLELLLSEYLAIKNIIYRSDKMYAISGSSSNKKRSRRGKRLAKTKRKKNVFIKS